MNYERLRCYGVSELRDEQGTATCPYCHTHGRGRKTDRDVEKPAWYTPEPVQVDVVRVAPAWSRLLHHGRGR